MKLAAFLTSIFPTAVFKNADLPVVLAASTLNDIELPDEVATQFNSHYMTADRAINDTNVGNKWWGKLYGRMADEIESELKGFLPYMPQEFQDKYKAIPKDQKDGIYARVAVLKEGIAKVAEGGQPEDVKQAAAKFREKERELREQVTKMEAERKKEKEEGETRLNDYKIDFELQKKYQSLVPKLDATILNDKRRDFLFAQNIADLRSNFILEFDKENPSQINFLKKDRTAYYEGNEPVTLDQYIEKQLDEFIVKNPGGTTSPAATKKVVTKEVNSGNGIVTAKDRRFAAAATNGVEA